MKITIIYEGKLGEDITEELPGLVNNARMNHLAFYLLWNGVLLFIDEKSTVDGVLKTYYEKISK